MMQAMSEREKSYVLPERIQLDDACLDGALNGGKPERGSEKKVSIVAPVSLDEAVHPIHVKAAKVQAFSFAAIADWAQDSLARGYEVILRWAGLLPCSSRSGLHSSACDR
jgi:hypothetical protein